MRPRPIYPLCFLLACLVPAARGQSAGAPGAASGSPSGGSVPGALDRVQVMFTPTICKVHCNQQRCVNQCERGNVTTLFSGPPPPAGRANGDAFRVFVCRLLCKNGGVCLLKDRCLCPSNFTGKFCQIPVTSRAASRAPPSSSSSNEIVKPPRLAVTEPATELTRSEYLLPLGGQNRDLPRGAAEAPLVKVRVQHPPEASVKVHQVTKVSAFVTAPRPLSSDALSGSAGAPAPSPADLRAQTPSPARTLEDRAQHAAFKYCFREVKDGQCSSPLPGLRSREMCCRGLGKAWGSSDCVLCPPHAGPNNSSCPVGFQPGNGTKCVDVNECLQADLCEHGLCVNTAGSYSCACKTGFILDASHGLCISQSVISEEKGQCHRVLGWGRGPSSCSLPILRNITKQICCCSRVGKAWGPQCQRCPYFGSAAFKEICPAGPGYHYSASVLQFSQRAADHLGAQGAPLVTHGDRRNHVTASGEAARSRHKPSSGRPSPTVSPPPWRSGNSGSAARHPPRIPDGPATRPGRPKATPPAAGENRGSGQGAAGDQKQVVNSGQGSRPNQGVGRNRSSDQKQGPTRNPGSSQNQETGWEKSTSGDQASGHNQATSRRQIPGGSSPSNGSQAAGVGQGVRISQSSQGTDRNQGGANGGQSSSRSQGASVTQGRGDSLPEPARRVPEQDSGPSPPEKPKTSVRPAGACQSKPDVCGGGRCVDQPGGRHACVCHQGYRANDQRTHCRDVNECLASRGVCAPGECVNSAGSYRCVCPPGYEADPGKSSCQDVNECEDPLLCPAQECVNNPGSYRCVSCQPGFGLLNGLCTDIDECVGAPCVNGGCENTPGSFRCICRRGYKLNNRTCADVDECADGSPCPGQMCVNSVGSFRCVSCRPGYALINDQCADVNECEDGASCPGGRCVNTKGSYKCVDCRQGYRAAGGACRDVDECASASACQAERVCVNTVGSFRCDCLPGYRTFGRGPPCGDIDECVEENWCPPTGECVNTPGSFKCLCPQGYTLSDGNKTCADLNECAGTDVCADGECVNTQGSFACRCRPGFVSNPRGDACLDVDECGEGSACGRRAVCRNLPGTYECVCDPGFTSAPDGDSCVDEDECATMPGVCGSARCDNLEGSFMCECRTAGERFDPTTRRCVNAPPPPAAFPVQPPPPPSPGELRECYHQAGPSSCSLLAANTSRQECCCTLGEGWGLGCRYHACPPAHSADFLALCPGGRGYVTAARAGFSYTDVDECKRFHPHVCKNGVCVNNIPGYSCYCSSGFVYNVALLQCVDVDECEQEICEGGSCVNTLGSYYCSCPPPLALDDSQRKCVNASQLTLDENVSVCWQTVSAELLCQSPLLGAQVTFSDCCCLYGHGWGMECALCPPADSDDLGRLCSSFPPAVFPDPPGPARGQGPPFYPPFGSEAFPPDVLPDYDDYSPVGGDGSDAYPGPPRYDLTYYPGSDYERRRAFGAGPPPGSAPLPPGSPLAEEDEESEEGEPWAPNPPFPPYGGGHPARLYERRYEAYAGLSAAGDCGILDGCRNGTCIRLDEGYTCDCYHGYRLDAAAMACVDVNECEDGAGVDFPCVNSRCVNTDGSFRCVCRRGYVMSRRPNRCVPA